MPIIINSYQFMSINSYRGLWYEYDMIVIDSVYSGIILIKSYP